MSIEPEVWAEFQRAFIGADFVAQVLAWTGLTTILIGVITALFALFRPIPYLTGVKVKYGFYEGLYGRVVDKRFGAFYTIDRGNKRGTIVVFRFFLEVRNNKLSHKLREKLLERS